MGVRRRLPFLARTFSLELEQELSDRGRLVEISDWGGKAAGLALRFAGLLHEAEHAGEGADAPELVCVETLPTAFLNLDSLFMLNFGTIPPG